MAIRAILVQRSYCLPYVIYFTSMTLNDAQLNYSTIEREMLAVGFKMIIFTNHDALKHLLAKKDVETMLIYWVYFCTNLIFEFRDKKTF